MATNRRRRNRTPTTLTAKEIAFAQSPDARALFERIDEGASMRLWALAFKPWQPFPHRVLRDPRPLGDTVWTEQWPVVKARLDLIRQAYEESLHAD